MTAVVTDRDDASVGGPDEEDPYEYSYTGTGQRIRHHGADQCDGRHCVIHSPSPHHMIMWPVCFRFDRAPLMERICRHGVGHPDPDSLRWLEANLPMGSAWAVHGCDGCCRGTDGCINE